MESDLKMTRTSQTKYPLTHNTTQHTLVARRVRKMRNRVHAKVTRQRKKVFVSAIEKATSLVWEANEKLREALISCGGLKVEA